MRAEEDAVEMRADIGKHAGHLVVDGEQGVIVEQSPREARLIAGDDDAKPGVFEFQNGFKTTGYRASFSRRFDVIVAVFVNDAVAVQND